MNLVTLPGLESGSRWFNGPSGHNAISGRKNCEGRRFRQRERGFGSRTWNYATSRQPSERCDASWLLHGRRWASHVPLNSAGWAKFIAGHFKISFFFFIPRYAHHLSLVSLCLQKWFSWLTIIVSHVKNPAR